MNSIVASVGNLNAGDDTEKKEKVFNEMFYISGWFYGFATAGLCCFLSPLVSVWLGNKYVIGFDAVLAACVYFYIQICIILVIHIERQQDCLFLESMFQCSLQ